ncbi:uncharacterized protein A4U43_C03F1130 [Asparagus officinalis]|uniref:DYW domain-containing protein n=1 Tax=Asparagus officinalis TaxID=4686 RepID=A0A5P1F6F0_ASPOF|nr:pentatricopeptide repeat-containing protein At4g32450, mitochondrial-like [Asparagus officinalis]ONK73938.1 uncharacterized protein A4U43_C03F1130 [Asparagus officinalis]
MLRKRSSSILTLRALSKVSSLPLLFRSSNYRSISQNAQVARVFDGGQNPNGVSGGDFYERGDLAYGNQLNSSGMSAAGVGCQLNPNGFRGSSSNGVYGGNQYGQERRDLGEVCQWESNGSSAPLRNLNGFHGQNPDGYTKSNFVVRPVNILSNYQDPNAVYKENHRDSSNFYPSSGISHDGFGSGGPSQSAYGENGYQGMPNQDSYGHNRESTLPAGQHNLSQSPLADSLSQTGESVTYKGTLIELDEFCKKGDVTEAVEVLHLLRNNGVTVDLPRYLTLLQTCGETKSLEEARIVHNHMDEVMGELGVAVNNKMLDTYSTCGSMVDAYQLFEKMRHRNLTSWDTMINGLANNNLGEEAIDLFTQFKERGLQPDGELFIAVFNACATLGAVDEGILHFESMKEKFSIAPTMKHYVSLVDMLGRSGYLDEALEFIDKMPVEPSVEVWETLMHLCRVNGYKELGDRCFEIVEQLDPSRLTEQTKMGLFPIKASDMQKERKNNSDPFAVRRHTHELRAGDRSHPESDRIYAQLRALLPNMKEAGYIPNTNPVLHDIDLEARGEALMAHSEKLAAAYFLFTSPPRQPMRIIKNLRFCPDCHEAMKIISKLTGRLIICRDAKRFHHFENGVCSCRDYY